MAAITTKPMTAEEFYEFVHRPENRDRVFELERGEIVEMSRPGKRHGLVCANVSRFWGNYAEKRKKGYVCTNDTGMVVEGDPDSVRGPDVAFFEDAKDYLHVEEKYGEVPPLATVEVLSPNDSFHQVTQRVVEQLTFGVKLVWVIDPEAESVAVYRPGQQPYLVAKGQEITGEDALPEFRMLVDEFFRLPGQ